MFIENKTGPLLHQIQLKMQLQTPEMMSFIYRILIDKRVIGLDEHVILVSGKIGKFSTDELCKYLR